MRGAWKGGGGETRRVVRMSVSWQPSLLPALPPSLPHTLPPSPGERAGASPGEHAGASPGESGRARGHESSPIHQRSLSRTLPDSLAQPDSLPSNKRRLHTLPHAPTHAHASASSHTKGQSLNSPAL